MTDLEMTKRCAEAMGLEFKVAPELWSGSDVEEVWTKDGNFDPLHDDAQAMALMKKMELAICPLVGGEWCAYVVGDDEFKVDNASLNRAICECCANMMLAKKGASNDAETKDKDR